MMALPFARARRALAFARAGRVFRFGRVGAALAALGPLCTVVMAQSGNGYDLTWNSVDGGGHMLSTGGVYTLGGTKGQPDPGVMTDSSGIHTLSGAFWGGAGPVEYECEGCDSGSRLEAVHL